MGLRVEKVQEEIRHEVSQILMREVKDPRVGFVTVTGAKVSSDLSCAKVFVSVLGDEEKTAEALKALKNCTGFVRRELAHRIRMKFIPEISFCLDTTIEYSAHIQKLLNEINTAEQEEKRD